MRENARQGYFNGSTPPFGYDAVETEGLGNRGRRKRRLVPNEAEAQTVSDASSRRRRSGNPCLSRLPASIALSRFHRFAYCLARLSASAS